MEPETLLNNCDAGGPYDAPALGEAGPVGDPDRFAYHLQQFIYSVSENIGADGHRPQI